MNEQEPEPVPRSTEPVRPPHGWCPNCRSAEVIRVESGSPGGPGFDCIVRGFARVVPFARLICLSCGLVRDWVEDPADLAKLREWFGWQLQPWRQGS